MQKAVTMEALAERLDRLGFVIVPHGDHVGIRLALMTSVRVHVDAWPDRARLCVADSWIARSRGTGRSLPGARPVGHDALRYTLTEACITQMRQAFNALLAEGAPVMGSSTKTFSQSRALDAGEPAFIMQDARVHTNVR